MAGDALASMYQEVIIDNAQHPKNFRTVTGASRVLSANNPLCGDELTLFVTTEGDLITDLAFTGTGCAISKASASLMTVAAKGLRVEAALELFEHVHTMLTAESEYSEPELGAGPLAALSGVREYPTRVKCASLPWQTLRAALTGSATE